MAAEGSRRRLAGRVVLVLALVAIVATGLVVAFQDEVSSREGRDSATGRHLEASLAVEVEDLPLAAVTATLRLTNTSDRPAWFRGSECAGPGDPTIAPDGLALREGAALEEGPIRERLIAAGEATLRVDLHRSDGEFCDLGEGLVRMEPHDTVTWEYRSGDVPADRSSPLVAVAVVREATRRGAAAGRLRLAVPFPEVPNAHGLTVDQAVDVFLADPTVADLLAASGEDGVLTVVTREGDLWRMSLGSSVGDLSAEVHPDLSVSDVHVVARPGTAPSG